MFVLLVYVLILLAAFYFVTLAFGETHSPSGAHRHLDPSAQEKNKQLMETAWATEHIPQSHQRSVLSFLGQQCCIIPAEARHITILHQPSEFYEQLKAMVTAAERKVMMSALYIGDGPLSRGLMECIENKAKDMKAQGKAFEVNIILDYNRMHDRQNLKTVQNLLALDYEYDNKNNNKKDTEGRISIKVHLFQNPCEWNRLFTPLGRAKEVLGCTTHKTIRL
ncbi:hypothetical protein ADEAN_000969000 [Angomonas deanei]|uniref:CDP-diacylglycerol--glycerol-3-phosphate 3-phosphatidyltransferase n=1 Tax=Angomonas deanei TaxID=59799 RepID=A0A7G2CSY6_9TRYP|nr:hypothetical protein ADEAN_000969000 [Angomonas deanei]